MAALLATGALTLATSQAGVLVNTDFDTGYTAGATLNGQSGSADVGLTGPWTNGSLTTYTNYIQVINATGSDDLTYTVAGGGTIRSGSHVLRFTSPDTSTDRIIFRTLSPFITGQTIYMRMVMCPVVGTANGTVTFFVNDHLSATYLWKGNGIGKNTTNAMACVGNTSAVYTQAVYGVLTNSGTPRLLVASLNWNATQSKYDSVSLWMNPSATNQTPNAAAGIAAGNGATTLKYVGLSIANVSAGCSYDFDSFVIGTTWGDVVPGAQPAHGSMVFIR